MRRRGLGAVVAGFATLATACGGSGSTTAARAETVRVSGSTTVNPVAADVAEVLRRRGLRITVDAQGGSAGGISQLGQGQVEIAMSSKPVSDDDRRAFPGADFVSAQIGADAVAVVVRREVFDGGVKRLGKEQVRGLFEGRFRSWKALGGPDVEVFVYDKEPGRGTREVLDEYLYGSQEARPPPQGDNVAIVGGNEEGRTKVLSTRGGVTPLSASFIAGYPQLAAVAIDGIEPSPAHVVDRTYPLVRPLFLVTDGPPTGAVKTFVDYVLSDEGQKAVTEHGYLSLRDLGVRG